MSLIRIDYVRVGHGIDDAHHVIKSETTLPRQIEVFVDVIYIKHSVIKSSANCSEMRLRFY